MIERSDKSKVTESTTTVNRDGSLDKGETIVQGDDVK